MNTKRNNLKGNTIKDVAQSAGVSIATVSRVLNKQSGVSKQLQEKVQAAVQILNYQPNAIARALKNSQSRSVGLIIPDIENPFFPALVRGVEDAAQKQGYAVMLCNTDGKRDEEERYLRFLLSKQVDGVLFVGNLTYEQNEVWQSAAAIPIVLLDRRIPGAPFSSVLVDNELGAFMAVDHLIKQGRRHIAVIGGKMDSLTSSERVNGAVNRLKNHGYSYEECLLLNGDFTFEGGYQAAERLISSGYFFDAIFAVNDMMAIGVIECLGKYGRHIPKDVAVVGFDDIHMAAWYKPSLTTIRQPVYEMGRCALHMLIEQISGLREGYDHQIFMPELMIRQSSGTLGG